MVRTAVKRFLYWAEKYDKEEFKCPKCGKTKRKDKFWNGNSWCKKCATKGSIMLARKKMKEDPEYKKKA